MAGGHKKVILLFAGTAWLWSCRFLFHQFVHRDKTHKVIRDADALSALPAALVRCFDVDALDKLPQGVGGHFLQILVFVYPLDELLQIFNLSFLYFDFLLQGLDFHFKLHLLVLIGLAHQCKPFIRKFSGHIILIDTDKQPVKFPKTAFCLCQTLLIAAYEDLYNRGVSLVFLKEPHINTDTYKKALSNLISMTNTSVDFILEGVNKYLMALAKEQIRLAFEQSEKEVEDLHQRTREGIETARLNGKQIGQRPGAKLTTKKSIAAKEVIKKHSKDFCGTLDDGEVITLTGLSRNTYYKYKRELRAGT